MMFKKVVLATLFARPISGKVMEPHQLLESDGAKTEAHDIYPKLCVPHKVSDLDIADTADADVGDVLGEDYYYEYVGEGICNK